MKLCTSILSVLLLTASAALGASGEDVGFPTAASIPPDVVTTFQKFSLSNKYVFSAHLNPFYVQGDFNSDGKQDTAILIKQKATGKIGFAIVHGGSTTVQVLGAGRAFGNGGDNFSWMDAWFTYPKGFVGQGTGKGTPPKLKGDAIMVIKTEAASALVYWTGKKYAWYQQGD